VIYGVIALGYSEFYRELGVTPREAGVEAGKTLGDAVGLAIVITLVALILALGLTLAVRALEWVVDRSTSKTRRGNPSDKRPDSKLIGKLRSFAGQRPMKKFITLFVVSSVVAFVAVAVWLRVLANTRADDVKHGRSVEPFRIGPRLADFVPIEVLDVRADPVFGIETLRSDDTVPPELDMARKNGQLFYIGRSAGSAVLYDSAAQRSFVVPSTTLVFQLSNCETKYNSDEACRLK
jgi:hypothetical protein